MAQTLTEIRAMLEEAGLRPQKMFGQNFLIDHNLLRSVVELSGAGSGDAVVEIGPGTGALTDELLAAGARVLAVEIDRGLAELLLRRYEGRDDFRLLHCDVLAGKHAINPEVISEANRWGSGTVRIVGNLPYNIATPLVCELLLLATAAARGAEGGLGCQSLTITVQQELADRLAAGAGDDAYGAASVLIALLGRVELGRKLPPEAFWPRPKVVSRVMRIDVTPPTLETVPDAKALRDLTALVFGHRRKKIGALPRRSPVRFSTEAWLAALAAAGARPDDRPDNVAPEQFAKIAATLAAAGEV